MEMEERGTRPKMGQAVPASGNASEHVHSEPEVDPGEVEDTAERVAVDQSVSTLASMGLGCIAATVVLIFFAGAMLLISMMLS